MWGLLVMHWLSSRRREGKGKGRGDGRPSPKFAVLLTSRVFWQQTSTGIYASFAIFEQCVACQFTPTNCEGWDLRYMYKRRLSYQRWTRRIWQLADAGKCPQQDQCEQISVNNRFRIRYVEFRTGLAATRFSNICS